jgi:flagellar protein FlgJ
MAIGDAHFINALDTRQLTELRAAVGSDPSAKEARQVAQRFEALFVQNLLERMRDASMGDALFGSSAHDQYQGLFDQQLASNLAHGRGIGLAPLIERQILRQQGIEPEAGPALDRNLADYPRRQFHATAVPPAPHAGAAEVRGEAAWSSPEAFVRDLWPAAQRTARELGVPPRALIAQAALETGWGQQVVRDAGGRSSNNLFNIKAHRDWDGPTARVTTLEYRAGSPVREVADFRVYDSPEQAFRDYVAFLRGNPRYAEALAAGDDEVAFVRALEEAGYATDPRYAEKIERILATDVLSAAGETVKNPADRSTT